MMRVGGGGMGGSRVDEETLRRTNAEAPRIPHLWRRVAAMFAPYRSRIALTVVLVVIASGAGVIPPLLIQRVFDDALFPTDGSPDMRLLVWLVCLMVAIYVLAALVGIAQTWLTSTVGNKVAGDLRLSLFERLQSMDLAFFTRTKTGTIQSRLHNDVGGVSGVLTSTVTSIVGNTVTVGASVAAMIILDWRLTLIAVVMMPALVAVQRRVGQVRARVAARTQESLSDMTAITQETLSVSGILLSKTFHRQAFETHRYRAENGRLIELQVRLALSGQGFFALVTVVMSSVPAVIYLAAGWVVTGADDAGVPASLTAGTVVAFTAIQSRLLFPLMALMRVALEVQTSKALFARIFEYLDLEPSIVDSPDAIAMADAPGPTGQLEFRDVALRYPDAPADAPPTVAGVSLRVAPGEHHALVGASGAGKTTLLYLAARLHEASAGQVLVSGADVRTVTRESLIGSIGVVTQETYLFHATIADNVRYARPDATDEQIVQACKAADIHRVIETFADGYQTIVGERGYRLSGGEKQRVAIARVLLKDPQILLLDEATSALDTVSEATVREALERATQGRTTLTIAHRLSTVVQADMIHVMSGGRVVESGTHVELIEAGGEYARLTRQLES